MGGVRTVRRLVACSTASTAVSESERLRFQTTPAEYATLGLSHTIAPREDGRRTTPSSENFEWWYLDDGTVVAVWFDDNWLYGSHQREVNIELTLPGQKTRRIKRTFDEAGAFRPPARTSRSVPTPSRETSTPTASTSTPM